MDLIYKCIEDVYMLDETKAFTEGKEYRGGPMRLEGFPEGLFLFINDRGERHALDQEWLDKYFVQVEQAPNDQT